MMEISQVVEAYVEDRATKGPEYARERLAQKWSLSCLDKQSLMNAVCDWEETARRQVMREKRGYKLVMGIATAAFLVNIAVVFFPNFPSNVKMFYCCFVAAACVLFVRFVGFSKEAAQRLYAEAAIAESLRKDITDLI